MRGLPVIRTEHLSRNLVNSSDIFFATKTKLLKYADSFNTNVNKMKVWKEFARLNCAIERVDTVVPLEAIRYSMLCEHWHTQCTTITGKRRRQGNGKYCCYWIQAALWRLYYMALRKGWWKRLMRVQRIGQTTADLKQVGVRVLGVGH